MSIASVVLPASPDGDDWTITGNIGHAAVLLADGTVLLAGGDDDGGQPVASAQIWDPASATVRAAGSMTSPRSGHTMSLLPDGRVLVAGGSDGHAELASLEIFDPATGSFTALAATLATARRGHRAVTLADGHVVIQGGTRAGTPVASNELFDSADESIAIAASLDGLVFTSVGTGRNDYPPGDIVDVAGAGWQPGETVELLFDETPIEHWPHVFHAVAAEDGSISSHEYQLEAHDLGTSFILTATGMTSGATAQSTFSDSSALSYAPASQAFTLNPGANIAIRQTITAPIGTGAFTITPLVVGTGSAPMPAAWITTNPTSLDYVLPDTAVRSNFWNVTFTVPAGTRAARYTANLVATPSVNTVDPGTGSAFTVTVPNIAPVASAGGPYTVPEGGTVQLAGSGTDANADTLTFTWDLDNNGTFETSGQNPIFSAAGRDGPGTQTIGVRACDPGGLCTNSPKTTVTITNAPPTATLSVPDTVNEGSSFTVALTDVSDPSPADVAAGFQYAFDCGLGFGSLGPTPSATCPTSDNGTLAVAGKLVDKDGGTTEIHGTVTVNNVAPTAVFSAPAAVNEGDTIVLTLTSPFDPSVTDTAAGFRYAFDCGDGAGYGPFGSAPTASCPTNDSVPRTVHGAIQDKDGGTSPYDAVVAVNDVAPTASLGNDGPVTESSPVTATFSGAFDPSSADSGAGFHYAFHCDGTAPSEATYASSGAAASTTCVYPDNGTFLVVGRIIDKDDGFTQANTTVVVLNVAPTATLSNDGPIDEGGNATVTFSNASDPSPVDTAAGFHYAFACHHESLDGATYANSSASPSTSCAFDDDGSFVVAGRIFDKDGDSTDSSTTVVVGEVLPTAALANNGPIPEGGSATVTFTGAFDPSHADTAGGFHYAFACHGESLDDATFENSGNSTSTSCAYDDNGVFVVTGRIITDDEAFTEDNTTVVVLNVDPTATLSNSGPIAEGGTAIVAFSGAFDPSGADRAAGFHYAFACDGASLAGATYATSGAAASTACTFDASGEHPVRGRIIDKDDGSFEAITVVGVNDVPPTAVLSNDGPVAEGSPVTVTFTDAFDPSAADTAAGFHYAFACTDDESLADATYVSSGSDASSSCTYPDNGTYTVRGRIIDQANGFSEANTTVIVTNVAPTAEFQAPAAVNEGTLFTLALVNAFDPSSVDTAAGFGYEFDCGSGEYSPIGPDASLSCAGADSGDRHVRARITDKDGDASEYNATVSVLNVAPTASLSSDGAVPEGSPATVRFTNAFDPGPSDTAAGFHYAFHCDGSPLDGATYAGSDAAASTTCTFARAGKYTVSGRILDKDDGFTDYTTVVTVTNAPPVIGEVVGPTEPVEAGTPVSVTASFSDAGSADTHTCSVDWGDGESSAGQVTETAGNGTCAATHTYAAGGTFAVTLTISDDEGASATATIEIDVGAVQATGGITFGEGTIQLPAGADVARPWVSGRAEFAFLAEGGSGHPFAGVTELTFLKAGFLFTSARVESLEVDGATAVYRGSGAVNGHGGYTYTVTAVNGHCLHGSGVDELRFQVWGSNGALVFDTAPGAGEGDGDTSPIHSGFIFVEAF